MHNLQRLIQSFPDKARSQDRMLIHDILPGLPKQWHRQAPIECPSCLARIRPRMRRIQRVEEYTLLHRREDIHILDIFKAHLDDSLALLILPSRSASLLNSSVSKPASGKSVGV